MRLIFDLHILSGISPTASERYLEKLIIALAHRHSEHSFIFLSFKPLIYRETLPGNLTIYYLERNYMKLLGKKCWYRYLLPTTLSALEIDLFVTADNLYIRKVPLRLCVLTININALLQAQPFLKNSNADRRSLRRVLGYADTIISFSGTAREMIQTCLPAAFSKLTVLKPWITENPLLKWTEKELVKIEFAKGMEYFVFAGDFDERFDLLGLLKAFSLFKKWQHSNMQLVMVGNKTRWGINFLEKLASYKYRNDVQLLFDQSNETEQKIIAGAYAFVYPAFYDYFPINILSAMQSEVPVISSPLPVCEEWFGNAVMYPETNDTEGFAKSLQLIYKDEKLRSGFIALAKTHLSEAGNQAAREDVMNLLEQSIAK